MPSLKFILPIFLLIFMSFLGHSQSPTIDCNLDSAAYLALFKMLDSTKISNIYNLDLLYYSVLSPGKKRDCFCELLIYARIFDFMLEKGLDLQYQVAQNPPRRNSTNVPDDLAQINNNNKYHIFRQFLKIKKEYENSVLKRYNNDKSRMLGKDIDNILKYHIYAYPNTLKDILLGKYAQLTKEKLQAELDEYYSAPASKH